MSLKNYKATEVANFAGSWTRLEPTDVPPTKSLYSLNCEYGPGNVSTRRGFASVWNPEVPIQTMYNWVAYPDAISTQGNWLAYLTTTGPKVRIVPDLTNPVPVDLYDAASAVGASFAQDGSRLFSTAFKSDGTGAVQGRVTSIDVAALYTDKLFLGPVTTKPSLSNTGTGSVTAGQHRVGYVIQTRNGFVGKISPVDSLTGMFDTTSVITAPGSQTISFSITGAPWPTEAAYIYIVMTPTTNLNTYYIVPGLGPYGVTGTSTVTATIDISDEDLIANSTDVTQNANLLTQDQFGAGPFNPFLIVEYGQRVVYFTVLDNQSQYYASDPSYPQQITADQNVRYLPGFRKIVSAFVLRGVLYVLGPHWTYADYDNPSVTPVNWPAPTLVDSAIGAMGPLAVNVNSTQGFAWVADEAGLYLFRGANYDALPVSYYNDPDWSRINLNAGYLVQVKDNKDKQECYVLVPRNGLSNVSTSGTTVTWVSGDYFNTQWQAGTAITINNVAYTIASVQSTTQLTLTGSAGTQTNVYSITTPTYCTHIYKFDYSNGSTAELVRFSLYQITGYNPGAIEVVQNGTTKKLELWVGDAQAGPVMRQMDEYVDALPFTDNGQAIDCEYETALQPGMNAYMGNVFRHYACQVRIKGNGTVNVTTYGLDRTINTTWAIPITLSTSNPQGAGPGQEFLRRFGIKSESVSHRFVVNEANGYFILSAIRHFYMPGPAFR